MMFPLSELKVINSFIWICLYIVSLDSLQETQVSKDVNWTSSPELCTINAPELDVKNSQNKFSEVHCKYCIYLS